MHSSTVEADRVGLRAFIRPALSLLSGITATFLCGLVVYLASGGALYGVDRKWIAMSLFAGVLAVGFGVLGIEDGWRGRLAAGASAFMVAVMVWLWVVMGPTWYLRI